LEEEEDKLEKVVDKLMELVECSYIQKGMEMVCKTK
jgi:hypothetical protein